MLRGHLSIFHMSVLFSNKFIGCVCWVGRSCILFPSPPPRSFSVAAMSSSAFHGAFALFVFVGGRCSIRCSCRMRFVLFWLIAMLGFTFILVIVLLCCAALVVVFLFLSVHHCLHFSRCYFCRCCHCHRADVCVSMSCRPVPSCGPFLDGTEDRAEREAWERAWDCSGGSRRGPP